MPGLINYIFLRKKELANNDWFYMSKIIMGKNYYERIKRWSEVFVYGIDHIIKNWKSSNTNNIFDVFKTDDPLLVWSRNKLGKILKIEFTLENCLLLPLNLLIWTISCLITRVIPVFNRGPPIRKNPWNDNMTLSSVTKTDLKVLYSVSFSFVSKQSK